MEIRAARESEVDAVVAVGHETWPSTYGPIAGMDYVRDGLEKWWTVEGTFPAIADGRVLVAVEDGGIVGMTLFSVDDTAMDIWKLYVVPAAQGSGAGGALLRAAIAEAQRRRLTEVRLAHLDGNQRAREFYEHHGFRETHREPDQLGGPDSVWMLRPLP